MNWFTHIFGGKVCGTGGDEPKKVDNYTDLWDFITKECHQHPDQVLELKTDIKLDETFTQSKVHWIRSVGGKLNYVRVDTTLCGNSTEQYLDEHNWEATLFDRVLTFKHQQSRTYLLSWETKWHPVTGMEPRIVDIVKAAIESAPKYTYGYAVGCWYAVAASDEYVQFQYGDDYGNIITHRPWVVDLALSIDRLKVRENAEPFIVHDHNKVDYKLLPVSHWRRWVRVTDAANNATAALKIVPRGVGQGKVAYHDILFDFDDVELAGTAFSAGELLKGAIEQAITNYTGKPRYYSPEVDTVFDPEAVQVRFAGQQTGIERWLDLQRESTNNLERPYLSPNQPVVKFDGHKFQITADYYIDFTPWDATK